MLQTLHWANMLTAELPCVMVCSVSVEQLARAFHRYRISITDRMHRSLVRLLLFSFSAWRDMQTCMRFVISKSNTQKHTHPLHGEQFDLIRSAFEKLQNILEHRHGPLQVTRGSLADYTRQRINDDLIKLC